MTPTPDHESATDEAEAFEQEAEAYRQKARGAATIKARDQWLYLAAQAAEAAQEARDCK